MSVPACHTSLNGYESNFMAGTTFESNFMAAATFESHDYFPLHDCLSIHMKDMRQEVR